MVAARKPFSASPLRAHLDALINLLTLLYRPCTRPCARLRRAGFGEVLNLHQKIKLLVYGQEAGV